MLFRLKKYAHDADNKVYFAPKKVPVVFLSPAKRPCYAVFEHGFCEIDQRDDGKYMVPSVDGQKHAYDFDVIAALAESADGEKFEAVKPEDEPVAKVEAEAANKRGRKPIVTVRVGGK